MERNQMSAQNLEGFHDFSYFAFQSRRTEFEGHDFTENYASGIEKLLTKITPEVCLKKTNVQAFEMFKAAKLATAHAEETNKKLEARIEALTKTNSSLQLRNSTLVKIVDGRLPEPIPEIQKKYDLLIEQFTKKTNDFERLKTETLSKTRFFDSAFAKNEVKKCTGCSVNKLSSVLIVLNEGEILFNATFQYHSLVLKPIYFLTDLS